MEKSHQNKKSKQASIHQEPLVFLPDANILSRSKAEYTSMNASHRSHHHRSHHDYVLCDSVRIGNFINDWYFGSMPGFNDRQIYRDRFNPLSEAQCPGLENMCFGKYIKETGSVTPLSTQKVAALNQMSAEFRVLWYYPIYMDSALQLVSESLGADLAIAKQRYAETYAVQIDHTGSKHCVVHYRVGDYLENEFLQVTNFRWINPKSVASAVASFTPQPETIEILGGGKDWASSGGVGVAPNKKTVRKSVDILDNLRVALEGQLPSARVIMSTNGSADEDWFKIATSPMVVLGPASSFGLTAAMAGVNNKVRSANPYDIQVHKHIRLGSPTHIRPGWTTYPVEII
jgi:hypothetical protein